MNDPLIVESDKIKGQAGQILRDSDLEIILASYGVVKLTGSYPLNVMLRPDLDLYATVEKHDREKFKAVVDGLFAKNYFHEICYTNWSERIEGICGHYFQLKIEIGGIRWKLDVWLMTEDQYQPYTRLVAK